jgi:2-succinyl-6-hydroxy-2,4-cyclohexadiene-1-carboxylate synthase
MTLPLHIDWDGADPKRRKAKDVPALALLHGFAGDSSAWDWVRPGLRELGPTLAIDLMGHGQSPAPDDVRRYTMDATLGDFDTVLRDLRLPPCWWIGYSLGGRVVLNLAVRKPELVRGVVLVSASPGLQYKSERDARLEEDEALAQFILAAGMEAFVERWLALPLFAGFDAMPEERIKLERERRLGQRPIGLANSLRGLGTGAMPPLWERLGEIKAPVLVVTGDEDEKFSVIGTHMVGRIPGAHMARVPASTHAPQTEQPDDFVRVVSRFIRAQDGAAMARVG